MNPFAAGRGSRIGALLWKEFVQLRRDPRSLGLLVAMPVVFLLLFGYGIDYNVRHVSAEFVGHDAPAVRAALERDDAFTVARTPARDERAARADLRSGAVTAAVLVDAAGRPTRVLLDASDLLPAATALRNLRVLTPAPTVRPVAVHLL
jgi:ABC-2 type transport system permease protein